MHSELRQPAPRKESLPAACSILLQAIPVKRTPTYSSLRLTGLRGLALLGTAIVGLGVFVGQTTIAGAVVSSGILVVDSGAKPVQHVTGGTVATVLVHNGDRVTAGQVLMQLDLALLAPNLSAATIEMLQTQARIGRLEAERDGIEAPSFAPFDVDAGLSREQYDVIVATERDQFARRHEELAGELNELSQRISQAEAQVQADEAQLASASEQRTLAENQLADLNGLYKQELVAFSRVADAQQSVSQLKGREASLRSTVTGDKARVAELSVTRIQAERVWRRDVSDKLAEAQSAMARVTAQVSLYREEAERLAIRAPQDGIVHELGAFAEGSIIQAGQQLMQIVPDHDKLLGQVKIRPGDIDQLYPGQTVTIQFSAFERATTPSVEGHLADISPDLVEDPRTGSLHYSARIVPEDSATFAATGLKLVPGMPIEAFIKTEDRTILSYLTKPLMDQVNRAFR